MIVTHMHLSFKFNSHCSGSAGREGQERHFNSKYKDCCLAWNKNKPKLKMKLNEMTLKKRAIANKSGKKRELVTRKVI